MLSSDIKFAFIVIFAVCTFLSPENELSVFISLFREDAKYIYFQPASNLHLNSPRFKFRINRAINPWKLTRHGDYLKSTTTKKGKNVHNRCWFPRNRW